MIPDSTRPPSKLAHLRAEREFTLEELALRSGLAPETVRRLEKGLIRRPRLQTFHKIARGLGVPVEELLTEPAEVDA